ncbi:MAG TPA: PRC-barrel domain-containing protein [Planctomycetota bacterium]|nr:PRC-barrel domain-containing protein [Planctomycetota bacterium]
MLIATACVALLPSAVLAQSAAPGALNQDSAQTYPLYPCGKLLGLKISNDSDKGLGEIGDILIDPRSGEIRYAVLEVGGFLGVGEDRRVVPWSFIQIKADEKDAEKCHARTTLTEQQVKAAPTVKKDQRFEADLDKRIEASFGKDDSWAYTGKGTPMLVECSELDGVVLRDPSNKEVGKVQDVILAPMNSCIAYAVVDTTKEAGDKDVALPWSKVAYTYDNDHKLLATTQVELARFGVAPEYDKKDWKRMSSTPWMTELCTYYGCDPFWKTARFASAPKPPAPPAPKPPKNP